MALPMKNNRLHLETVQYAKNTNSDREFPNGSLNNLNPQKSMFLYGPSSIKQDSYGKHPLQQLEETRHDREQYRNFTILRSVQGIHAPLRLLAERKAAAKIGHLPFLPRSNLMEEVLDGRDEMIMPNDIFSDPREFCEVQLPPHLLMERQLGIL